MNKSQISLLAQKLLKKNKIKGWKFTFNNSLYGVASTNYRTKTIGISNRYRKFVSKNEKDLKSFQVKNLLLHEIAHIKCFKGGWGSIYNLLLPHRQEFWDVYKSIGGELSFSGEPRIYKVYDLLEWIFKIPFILCVILFVFIIMLPINIGKRLIEGIKWKEN